MTPTVATILRLADKVPALSVPDIANHPDLQLTVGRVYAVLREHRTNRPRKVRRRTSGRRRKIEGLLTRGIAPARIAKILQGDDKVSRQYVYRVAAEAD